MSKYINLSEIVDCQDHTEVGIDNIISSEYDMEDFSNGYDEVLSYELINPYIKPNEYRCECGACVCLLDEKDDCECEDMGDCNCGIYNKEQIELSRATLEYIQIKQEKDVKNELNSVFIKDIVKIIDSYITKSITPRTILLENQYYFKEEERYTPNLYIYPSLNSNDINLGFDIDHNIWYYMDVKNWIRDTEYTIDRKKKVPLLLRNNLIVNDDVNCLIINRFYND